MPDGLSEQEQREWLLRVGQQIVAETGQPSGCVEDRTGPGQPSWIIWWTDDPAPDGTATPPP